MHHVSAFCFEPVESRLIRGGDMTPFGFAIWLEHVPMLPVIDGIPFNSYRVSTPLMSSAVAWPTTPDFPKHPPNPETFHLVVTPSVCRQSDAG